MGDSCRAQRVLVATSDQSLRRSALFTFARLGCEVHAAESGIDCLDKLRGAFPDLLVLMPPLVWGSVADVLIVAREDSRTVQFRSSYSHPTSSSLGSPDSLRCVQSSDCPPWPNSSSRCVTGLDPVSGFSAGTCHWLMRGSLFALGSIGVCTTNTCEWPRVEAGRRFLHRPRRRICARVIPVLAVTLFAAPAGVRTGAADPARPAARRGWAAGHRR